ncbi:pilus assembly protein PilP [Reinekea marinisedimentorum]|uniref:Type IV pilus assembly protein PilP n=1 Tax=Reinekea marinisedimentorum TaxID=230495 RepID=A0A4R3I0X5_9GAMM|nr:pilus assembly protein PilP [Reinekea marinisedimentorum]TCS38225.1 type IV pilus assembly protein PilP [Reinekea marinisedimentorum]
MSVVNKALVVLVLPLVLFSCVKQDPLTDLKAFVQEQDSRPKGKIPPPPEFAQPEFVSYTASSLRSPFEVPRPVELVAEEKNAPKSNVSPDFGRVKEYLETFRIENISMVGTLYGLDAEEVLWALVKDAQGEVHKVRVGNYLGRNFGRIVDISETQIDLIEIVPSGKENWVERPRVILLNGLDQ